jgi:hypothetical protein
MGIEVMLGIAAGAFVIIGVTIMAVGGHLRRGD